MKKFLLIVVTMLFFSAGVRSENAVPPNAAPGWLIEEIATLTAGTGRWTADNADYKSENEPYDAYTTEWTTAFDGTSMSGRL